MMMQGDNSTMGKGVHRRGKWNNFDHEESLGNSFSVDTVYHILCPSRKIGGVIGKAGSIVEALREETQDKTKVADSVPGSDERVITIYSSPEKVLRNQNNDEDSTTGNEQETVERLCAAQDALLKVHERIVEEGLSGRMAPDYDNENIVVTARLLVPNNMTGGSIRVLPGCAMSTDELVQISTKLDVAKRALYEISTLLHLNPRKDKPPSLPMSYNGQNFHPPGGPIPNTCPPGNPLWPHRNYSSQNLSLMPWMGGCGIQPTRFGPGGSNGAPPGHGGEPSDEFSMKILSSAWKIGGVIGKGGSNVKLVQQATGTSIHVEDASEESDERVIWVSAFEALRKPRSQTIDAVLQLQNKTREYFEKRGQVINEMRRRPQAHIFFCSKDDKLKWVAEDEELVQISGNFTVAKDALVEIASRLRVRTLPDANAGAEPGPAQSLSGRGPPPSGTMGASNSSGYEPIRDVGHKYGPQNYPVPPAAIGYCCYYNLYADRVSEYCDQVAGISIKLEDPLAGGPENIVEFHGSSEHLNATHNYLLTLVSSSSSGQNRNTQQGSYQNNMTAQKSSYQNVNAQLSTYQNKNAQNSPYQNINVQESSYSPTQQVVYTNNNSPESTYQNINAQQGIYQY
uniref:K Homology domain-containing protein n=1 Tax=Manihot esculenta TaxID=3983 RepID=A0A2C9WBI8_MANES